MIGSFPKGVRGNACNVVEYTIKVGNIIETCPCRNVTKSQRVVAQQSFRPFNFCGIAVLFYCMPCFPFEKPAEILLIVVKYRRQIFHGEIIQKILCYITFYIFDQSIRRYESCISVPIQQKQDITFQYIRCSDTILFCKVCLHSAQ